jgi:hypothetical protein
MKNETKYICKWCEKVYSKGKPNNSETCLQTGALHELILYSDWKNWKKDLTKEQMQRLIIRARLG